MKDWDKALEARRVRSRTPLERFPQSARESIRDQLQTIRVQLEVIGLDEAEIDVRQALVSVCAGFGIPSCLTVSELVELGKGGNDAREH